MHRRDDSRAGRLWACPVGILLAVGAAIFAAAPAVALEARALVDRTTITVHDVLGLTVVVTGGDGEVDVSPIRDFEVEGRGRSSSVQIVNTRMTREVRYRYALAPTRTGALTIPALPVGEGDEQALTEPIRVQVLESGDPAAGEAPITVEADLSENEPYVGQELVYTFRLSTAVQLVETRFQPPAFEGFSVVPLEEQRTYRTVRNGRELSVTEVRFVLTPQRDGTLPVGSAVLSCQVPVEAPARRGRDPFGLLGDPFFGRTPVREKTFRTRPDEVRVRPLPPVPDGQEFSGLVGTFGLGALLSPATVKAGESVTLTVSLEGRGNVAEAPAPELSLPASFKNYPDEPVTEVEVGPEGTRGTKQFRFALVPTRAGSFTVGPLRLGAFDPEAGRYRSLSVEPLALTVQPGEQPDPVLATPSSPGPEARQEGVTKQEVAQRGRDILEIHTGLDAIESRPEGSPFVLLATLLLPPLLYAGLVLATRQRGLSRPVSARMAEQARAEVERARSLDDGDGAERLAGLRRALIRSVLAVAGRSGEGLTDLEVEALLRGAGRSGDTVREVLSLLSRIDARRYAGPAADAGDLAELVAAVELQVRDLLREKSR